MAASTVLVMQNCVLLLLPIQFSLISIIWGFLMHYRKFLFEDREMTLFLVKLENKFNIEMVQATEIFRVWMANKRIIQAQIVFIIWFWKAVCVLSNYLLFCDNFMQTPWFLLAPSLPCIIITAVSILHNMYKHRHWGF